LAISFFTFKKEDEKLAAGLTSSLKSGFGYSLSESILNGKTYIFPITDNCLGAALTSNLAAFEY
jgi:hypothetical protein